MALSFVTTVTPITQSVASSVRSLLDASSLSIPGFTTPLTLALFTSSSLAGNASLSNSSDISSATIVQSSSKETNSSSPLQIMPTTTLDVAGSSPEDINATKAILSNSVTFSGSLSSDSITRTSLLGNYSSLSFTESSRSTTLALPTSNSSTGNRKASSSILSRSNGIASPHSFQSSSQEASASSYFQVRTTIMQTVPTVTDPILSKSLTVDSSSVHNSVKVTSFVADNSSTHVHQGDSTETIRSTEYEGSFYSNATPGATNGSYSDSQFLTLNESHVLTSRTDSTSYISSTMSTLMTTVHGSRAPASNGKATHSSSPSISVSEPSRVSAHPSLSTVISDSSRVMSSIKTLQLNQTMHSVFETSRPSENRQSSESVLASNRVSVTTTMKQLSTIDSAKHTLNVSSVVTSYSNGVLPNTSVKDKNHISTVLSSFVVLETLTNQESLMHAESTINK